jgi:hypothetical protein
MKSFLSMDILHENQIAQNLNCSCHGFEKIVYNTGHQKRFSCRVPLPGVAFSRKKKTERKLV